ncbi:CHAT domain-containing tetratricopeptide repeat protein [Arsenicibacter rosenii]|uniref:CHAT domain-containing protein n=1 Tax=Arsenicibacter rosenii TaxID=1750698 RepID=A0A1S2VIR6_9BACT|nr:CHAT domain-containing tetratricopeptide repeat protein [Arsenicibacter rosenii]OIN58651.1 hypothetical protein BLX24_13880 [Arsenicibacter rosenii]
MYAKLQHAEYRRLNNQLLEECERIKAYDLAALVCTNVAASYTDMAQYDNSLEMTRRSWHYYQLMPNKTVAAKFGILSGLGICHQFGWQLDSAQYYFKQVAELLEKHNNLYKQIPIYVQDYYINYAYLNYQLMAYAEAINLSRQALQIIPKSKKFDTSLQIAGLHNTLGKCYREIKNFAVADSFFLKAVDVYKGYPLYQAIVYCNLAESQLRQQRIGLAEESTRKAGQLYDLSRKESGGKPDIDLEVRLLENFSELHWQKKQLPAAMAASKQLIAYSKKLNPVLSHQRVEAYCRLSEIYKQQKLWADAERMAALAIREAYGLKNTDPSGLTPHLPQAYLKALLNEAHLLLAMPMQDKFLRFENSKMALSNYEKAIRITASLRRSTSLSESKNFLSTFTAELLEPAFMLCYELSQQAAQSEEYCQRALDLLELSRNALLTDAQTEQQLARYYLPKATFNQLLSIKKQLSLLILLREKDRDPYAQQQISGKIQALESRLVHFQAQTERQFPQYASARRELNERSITSLQQKIAPTESVLSQVLLPKGLLLLGCSRKKAMLRFVPVERNKLINLVGQFKTEISRDPGVVGTYNSTFARQLYTYLLKPLEDDMLAGSTILTILPPPELMIPFEALEAKAGEFLIERYNIGYLFNLFALYTNELPEKHISVRPLVIAPFTDSGHIMAGRRGGPVLRTLPASRREIDIFGGDALQNEDATKKEFLERAPGSNLIVCVTHTVPEAGETALAFWPGEPDYLLYPSEIQHTDMRQSRLVVLSACETERGEALAGDGIQTLGRAFTWAGAKAVTCSLFPLNDSVQARLGNAFYRKLSDKQPIRETLREAKLDFLRSDEAHQSGRHPFFWAGVIVFGGSQPFKSATSQNYWPLLGALVSAVLMVGWFTVKKKDQPTRVVP